MAFRRGQKDGRISRARMCAPDGVKALIPLGDFNYVNRLLWHQQLTFDLFLTTFICKLFVRDLILQLYETANASFFAGANNIILSRRIIY